MHTHTHTRHRGLHRTAIDAGHCDRDAVRSCSPSTKMSATVGGEPYPGQGLSVSQLLYAARKKLQGSIFAGRCAQKVVWPVNAE